MTQLDAPHAKTAEELGTSPTERRPKRHAIPQRMGRIQGRTGRTHLHELLMRTSYFGHNPQLRAARVKAAGSPTRRGAFAVGRR